MKSGSLAGIGSFRCETCGYVLSLTPGEELPDCPACEGSSFRRASLFSGAGSNTEPLQESPARAPTWATETRDGLEAGRYLAFEDGDTIQVFSLSKEWTRIGRSLAADIRFDDPTVSRRHALIVRQPDGVRVLDDRSLNGVFVNGERVEWSTLRDGDEVLVGRHALRFLHVIEHGAVAGAAVPSPFGD